MVAIINVRIKTANMAIVELAAGDDVVAQNEYLPDSVY